MTTSSRITFRGAFAVFLVFALVACNLLKKPGADAGDAAPAEDAATAADTDAAPAADAATALTGATNENDVARFPDETKLDNVAATIKRWSTAREAPQTGKAVATLNNGQAVNEIAQRQTYFLVVFIDTKSQQTLEGWVTQDAFTPLTTDAGIKAPTCPAPEVALYSDSAFCGRTCTTDSQCPAGQACKGNAQPLSGGKLGTAVTVCVAGAAPVVVDAGSMGNATPDVMAAPCIAGYVQISKDHKCHRTCPVVNLCIKGDFCIKCDNQRVCSPDRNLCK